MLTVVGYLEHKCICGMVDVTDVRTYNKIVPPYTLGLFSLEYTLTSVWQTPAVSDREGSAWRRNNEHIRTQ